LFPIIVVVVVPKGTTPYQPSGILLEQTKCLMVDIKAYFPLAPTDQSELIGHSSGSGNQPYYTQHI